MLKSLEADTAETILHVSCNIIEKEKNKNKKTLTLELYLINKLLIFFPPVYI